MSKTRKLNEIFMDDLLSDELNSLLIYVKSDHTLDLEIRSGSINLYYRGGSILKVNSKSQKGGNSYNFDFNEGFLSYTPFIDINYLNDLKEKKNWNQYFPIAKQAMDFYFRKNKKEEREFQQLIVRDNNYSSIANSSDYFIIDIEYDNHKGARFDLVALEWESKASSRKLHSNYKPKLIVIELKYGDQALNGKAGLIKHQRDFEKFSAHSRDVNDFKLEMKELFNQKRRLGLVPCLAFEKNPNKIENLDPELEFCVMLINHDPEKSSLNSALSSLSNTNIQFLTSNFMGYGLFKNNLIGYSDFVNRFNTQIYEA